ncbi:MAG: hypothetical protein GF320_15130 [Armatimonadia bacterium]|nr:hypothetical protein [Armatimonadia bacterium]
MRQLLTVHTITNAAGGLTIDGMGPSRRIRLYPSLRERMREAKQGF